MIDIKSLKQAIVLQEKIEALKAELNATLGAGFITDASLAKKKGRPLKGMSFSAVTEEAKPKRKRRKLSPEALEKIREGQRKRWAKVHKEQKKAGK